MLTKNVGSLDRTFRIVLGIALVIAFFVFPGLGWARWLLLIGLVPLVTGMMGSCPLYSVLGLSTCRTKGA
jgi:hypothetical protein